MTMPIRTMWTVARLWAEWDSTIGRRLYSTQNADCSYDALAAWRWVRAETYYIRILNVSSVSAESSVFLLSQFCRVSFCDVLWPVVDSLLMWTLIAAGRVTLSQSGNVLYRILNVSSESVFWWQGVFCRVSFCWVSFVESVFADSDIAESDKMRYCWLCIFSCVYEKRKKYTSVNILNPYSQSNTVSTL